jgi:hypothetical protein
MANWAYLIPGLSFLLLANGLWCVGDSTHYLGNSNTHTNNWQGYSAYYAWTYIHLHLLSGL